MSFVLGLGLGIGIVIGIVLVEVLSSIYASKKDSNDYVHEYANVHGGGRGEDPDDRPNSYYDDDTGNNNLNHQYRQRQPRDFQSFENPTSNLNNNHDQDKIPYNTKEEADEVAQKMKRRGHDPNGTLVSHLNTELGAWFVGNNKKYY